MLKKKSHVYLAIFFLVGGLIAADNLHVFQEPTAFIKSITEKEENTSKYIWINKDLQKEIGEILGHPFSSLRIRYWEHNDDTIWVLDEIGKTEPITFGYLVENNAIKKATVLIFRESRGGEIHNEFYTKQFIDCQIDEKNKLSKEVNGITGATLSANAMKKTAALALFLNKIAKSNSNKAPANEK